MKIDMIEEARTRLAPWLKPTPLIYSYTLSRSSGKRVWLKLETQHPTGSFKVRPAFNGILSQLELARAKGVVASSSGNFAQAVAYAARELGVSAVIIMTSSTSPYKIERTKALGAEVVICGPTFQERWDTTFRIQKESGRLLLHPYDTEETMAGGGTLGLELLDQCSGEFSVVVPSSGGGLLAGVATAVKTLRPGCRVFGVQPKANASMARSLAAGQRVNVGTFTTMADSLVAPIPGEKTFQAAQDHVDDVLLVEEHEMPVAVKWLAEEQKLITEPGGAISVAALLAGKIPSQHEDVICVISGGNIPLQRLLEFQ